MEVDRNSAVTRLLWPKPSFITPDACKIKDETNPEEMGDLAR